MAKNKCKMVRNYCHCKVRPSSKFDKKSFRIKRGVPGVNFLVACPKGKYNRKSKRCKVGTQKVSIRFSKAYLKNQNKTCAQKGRGKYR